MTIQMKAAVQYFHAILSFTLYKVSSFSIPNTLVEIMSPHKTLFEVTPEQFYHQGFTVIHKNKITKLAADLADLRSGTHSRSVL